MLSSQTYQATPLSVIHNGLKPVFVDSDEYYSISLKDMQKKVTKKTSAVLLVNLYGMPCDILGILNFAQKYNLKVIEDNAQAQGARYCGQKTGTFGDIAATSFYPGKNIGALGDGGAVITKNEKIAEKVRAIRNDGRYDGQKYLHNLIGWNERLDSIHATALIVKLKYLDKWNKRRKEVAEIYCNGLKDVVEVTLPKVRPFSEPVWHQFVILVKNRDVVKEKLFANGVGAGIHYPIPCHLQPCLKEYNEGDCPNAEKYAKEVLSLPMFPEITDREIEKVIQVLKKVVRGI